MYEDLGESDHSNESIIYRENVLDRIDSEEDGKNRTLAKNVDYGKSKHEYDDAHVTEDVKEILEFIDNYSPKDIELDTKWKIFVPEYIPSCGDIDAFLKVENKSIMDENLGLKVLDEPSFSQSDPTIVELQQTALSKQTREKSATSVKKIKPDRDLEQKIDKWIEDIAELAAVKPVAAIQYRKPMPEIPELLKVNTA